MTILLYIITTTLSLLLSFVLICLSVFAILSWFPTDDPGPIRSFVGAVSAIVSLPVRTFLERFRWVQNCPLDISFFVTYLLLALLLSSLP